MHIQASRTNKWSPQADQNEHNIEADVPQAEMSRVFIVIPTFHPGVSLSQHLEDLAHPRAQVIIVDDGSGTEYAPVLDALKRVAIVVPLTENRGIATALNTGISTAQGLGATHVLTLDQDSQIGSSYVTSALTLLQRFQETGTRVACVGAGQIDNGYPGGHPSAFGSVRVAETLQSGSLFDIEVFAHVGTFDESLFIDGVDTEFTLRAATHGYATYLTPECAIMHQLGRPITRVRHGRTIVFAYHSPVRRYYMVRNRAVLVARYGRVFPRWAVHKTIDELREFLLVLIYLPGRKYQMQAAVLGLWDAAKQRSGRVTDTQNRLLSRGDQG